MKAIVLTYDRNSILTEHMIRCYEDLWPGHPFTFRIPYQDPGRMNDEPRREFVKTPPEIKATVLTLLQDLPDEDWVYWCIDDKYPIQLNISQIETIYQHLSATEYPDISSILYCRTRKMLDLNFVKAVNLKIGGISLLERMGYHQIWIHQFTRVKVLRYLFTNFPDQIERPGVLDPLKHLIPKPHTHNLYVTEENLSVFGESTFDGVITANCDKSLTEKGFVIPESFPKNNSRETIIGKL
jgi:hypothetical protein